MAEEITKINPEAKTNAPINLRAKYYNNLLLACAGIKEKFSAGFTLPTDKISI
jgi:hypothetical protein